MSSKDEVLSALSSFVSAFADYTYETDLRLKQLDDENKELRARDLELGEVFEVAARVLKRGSDI